jgi:hypothetical protein
MTTAIANPKADESEQPNNVGRHEDEVPAIPTIATHGPEASLSAQ